MRAYDSAPEYEHFGWFDPGDAAQKQTPAARVTFQCNACGLYRKSARHFAHRSNGKVPLSSVTVS
jgi:hypothetical protein